MYAHCCGIVLGYGIVENLYSVEILESSAMNVLGVSRLPGSQNAFSLILQASSKEESTVELFDEKRAPGCALAICKMIQGKSA